MFNSKKNSWLGFANNLLTEFTSLGRCKAEIVYIEDSIYTLYNRVIDDVIANLTNIEPVVESSFRRNPAIKNSTAGLLDLVVNAIYTHTQVAYEVDLIDGVIRYKKASFNSNSTNLLNIDGTYFRTQVLYYYYGLLYKYLRNSNTSLDLANKPLIKLDSMRSEHTSLDTDSLKDNVKLAVSAMRKEEGFIVVDGKSDVSIIQSDPSKYMCLEKSAYLGIQSKTGLPESYIQGKSVSSLNSTGEGERVMVERTLYSFYTNYIEYIIRRVYSIVGLQYDVVYTKYEKHLLKEATQSLQALDSVSFISEDKKREIGENLLNQIFKE